MITKHLGKIGKKIYLKTLSIALISIVLLAGLEVFTGVIDGRRKTEKLQSQIITSIAREIEGKIENVLETMKFSVASRGVLERGLDKNFSFYLAKILKYHPYVFEVMALNEKGDEVVFISRFRPWENRKNYSGEDFFKECMAGKLYKSKVYLLFDTKPYITLAIPMSLYSGKNIGVLALKLSLYELQRFISYLKVGKNGYVYVADEDGYIIAHPKLNYLLSRVNIHNNLKLSGLKKVYDSPGKIHHLVYKNINGERVFSTSMIINEFGWLICVEQPLAEVFSHVIKTMLFFSALLIAIVLIVFISSKQMAKDIAGPLLSLNDAAAKIGAGNLDVEVKVGSGDEVEELASQINLMAANLKNLYSQMEQKIDERTREVTTLLSFTSAISKYLDLKQVVQNGGEELSFILEFDGYAFFLLETEGLFNNLSIVASKGIAQTEIEKCEYLLKASKETLLHHNPVILNNVVEEIPTEKGFIRSLAFFPVIYAGKLLGIFLLFDTKPDQFDDSKKFLVDACMMQFGVSIKNAMLFEETKDLSLTDPLTSLPNRRYFERKISSEFDRFKRYERPFSLMMIDIDFFKKVNDNYGHQSGDCVLKKLGEIISGFVRKSDFPARYGGEEFAILLPETNSKQACIAAERLRKIVEDETFSIDVSPYKLKITISIGLSEGDKEMSNWHELVEKADKALYIAKQSGRNRYHCL